MTIIDAQNPLRCNCVNYVFCSFLFRILLNIFILLTFNMSLCFEISIGRRIGSTDEQHDMFVFRLFIFFFFVPYNLSTFTLIHSHNSSLCFYCLYFFCLYLCKENYFLISFSFIVYNCVKLFSFIIIIKSILFWFHRFPLTLFHSFCTFQ